MIRNCHACINLSRLHSSGFTPTLRSGSSPSSTQQRAGHIACTRMFGLYEIFKCAHFKFKVYGRKQTYTQLHKINFLFLIICVCWSLVCDLCKLCIQHATECSHSLHPLTSLGMLSVGWDPILLTPLELPLLMTNLGT